MFNFWDPWIFFGMFLYFFLWDSKFRFVVATWPPKIRGFAHLSPGRGAARLAAAAVLRRGAPRRRRDGGGGVSRGDPTGRAAGGLGPAVVGRTLGEDGTGWLGPNGGKDMC